MLFGLAVVKMLRQLPRSIENDNIRGQLGKAAPSSAANYRAACRARSRAEFVAKLGHVCEEIDESEFWLDLMVRGRIGPEEEVQRLHSESIELRAIFAASYRTARWRLRGKPVTDSQIPKSPNRQSPNPKIHKSTITSTNQEITKSTNDADKY